jgi:hypothetical protein
MAGNSISAQDLMYSKYRWDSIPAAPSAGSWTESSGALLLKNKIVLEYAYDEKTNNLVTYETVHKQYFIKSNEALEGLNKIYIGMDDVIDIVEIKARFISDTKKVIELGKENIKTLENLEEKGNFKLFAIEGAGVNGIIEYYYILKKYADMQGRYSLQGGIPARDVEFRISTPRNIRLLVKSYNGFPAVEEQQTEDKQTWNYVATSDSVPALEEEEYSPFDANKQRVEYAIAYNYAVNSSRIRSLDHAAHYMYSQIFEEDKKGDKKLKKLLSKLELEGMPQEMAVRKLENHVKATISYVKNAPPEANQLNEILEKAYASDQGFVKLFLRSFSMLGIPYELIITCDRNKRKFDPKYDAWNFLDEFLIYFPDLDKYMEPVDFSYRLGTINEDYAENYGLSLKLIKVSDLESFARDIRKIPASNYLKNVDSLIVKASVDPDMSKVMFDVHRVLSGQNAHIIQPYYSLLAQQEKTNAQDIFLKLCTNTNLQSAEVLNVEKEDICVKPLIMNAKADATIVEQAGNKFIVKIGELISKQAELYQELKRTMPVENQYNRRYFRIITFTIPEGYTIPDISMLNYSVLMPDDKQTSGFVSKAEIKGNELIVTVDEYYKQLMYPVDQFEHFRAVINAAADFNKKSIVLVKK